MLKLFLRLSFYHHRSTEYITKFYILYSTKVRAIDVQKFTNLIRRYILMFLISLLDKELLGIS